MIASCACTSLTDILENFFLSSATWLSALHIFALASLIVELAWYIAAISKRRALLENVESGLCFLLLFRGCVVFSNFSAKNLYICSTSSLLLFIVRFRGSSFCSSIADVWYCSLHNSAKAGEALLEQ
jgi:hypothetical protein